MIKIIMNSYYHDDLVASEELGEGLLAQGAPVLVGFVPIVAELESAGLAAEGEPVVDSKKANAVRLIVRRKPIEKPLVARNDVVFRDSKGTFGPPKRNNSLRQHGPERSGKSWGTNSYE